MRVLRHVIRVVQPLFNHDVHHAQCQCRIRARQGADVPIGHCRRPGFERIDHHHLSPGFAGLLDKGPQVQVGNHGVRPPQHDQAAVHDILGHHTTRGAHGRQNPLAPRIAANIALEPGCPQAGKEAAVE